MKSFSGVLFKPASASETHYRQRGKMIVGVRSSSVFSTKTLPNTLPEHSLSSLRTGPSYPERGIYVCIYVYSCSQCQDEKLNSRKKAICQGQEAAKQLRLGSKSEPTL